MELRHLRYFIRAAELLHFTKAAESLYVSQPALSVQIHQLEEELGVELFARVGRNVRLTEAGNAFLVHARQAVQSIEVGEQEVDAIKGLLRGRLHLCAVSAFGSMVLPPLIAEFQKAHPQVYVKLSSATSDLIERGLLDGTIDLGLLVAPLERDDLRVLEVFSDEIVVAVPNGHEFTKRKQIKPVDLDKLPVVLATQYILLERGLGFLESHGVQPKIMAESEETTGVINLIRSTGFAALIPKTLVPDDLRVISLEAPKLTLVVAWSHLTAAANAFLQVVKASAPLS
jgi:LysR family transcriptional regulator, cyn operon transcriptional activator